MTKLQLSPVGAALSYRDGGAFLDAVAGLEELGYATLWLAGGQLPAPGTLTEVVRATRKVQVASSIMAVDRFGAADVAAAYADAEATDPGRFIVGLGGAHGPKPLRTLGAYLDHLDTVPPTVPVSARMLAALGPRMLELARDRAAGAHPFLVTPEYTARARALLGEDATLVVSQMVVLQTDPERAREIARGPLGFLSQMPAYAANFRRMGVAEDDIAHLGDRLVDAVTAWGDVDAIAERVEEQLDAGADQVALNVLTGSPDESAAGEWRQLAEALIP